MAGGSSSELVRSRPAGPLDRDRLPLAGLRERITEIGYTDPVSQDLLIAVTADLEKQYWMFQAEQD